MNGAEYPDISDINFSETQEFFQNLPMFDGVTYNMQAMNITIIDQFITNYEYALLKEYFAREKTPVDTAMFVSALSQMWVFALYELLRTWRQRVRMILEAEQKGELDKLIDLKKDEGLPNLSTSSLAKDAKRIKEDKAFSERTKASMETVDGLWRLVHSFRINLAKHEIPGEKNKFHHFPGYGRINGSCGALDFEISQNKDHFRTLNRRDIAEMLRALKHAVKE
ncbi:MAG: hypothetical protein COW01_09860 [Bdellovibrionales bacterium CG12_big_fil_rev_8_21_14_0_65_38_15]|nr:MAG: hypothetical protein COW79_06645 [Bdellovibrionales bacterium CG22_combo_CG10-13_8_21_14_all_38_13]PIQ54441.1 MAG: hypothetical protein COW01_09860 [Bdellovibrionales bacterium CG12_big_fil_rev_8_21_14_0_65_38_15]PIR31490.1 MAG: hypothetical protein COV38_00185 [Bdellovibrionales bacterium CG11_big_fil_rev_8_21_14_0_20_38_13]